MLPSTYVGDWVAGIVEHDIPLLDLTQAVDACQLERIQDDVRSEADQTGP